MSHDPAMRTEEYQVQPQPVAGSTVDEATGPYTPDSVAEPHPGSATPVMQIPGYVIERELARGGMGRVLSGRELAMDREVAIKTLLPNADPTRFVTEAKITARLPHPSIPPVHALGTLADGTPYLAMKLVRGQTLAEQLKDRPQPLHDLPRFLQVFEQIAQAVGFAHAQGILHRDLKPANVMVGAFGEVQVMDWGLAKQMKNDECRMENEKDSADESGTVPSSFGIRPSALTHAGAVMGTPSYMAPEQARGEPATAASDVFALGGILCSILTGKAVFGGATVFDVLQQAAAGDTTEALARLDACGADPEVIALAKRCLAVSPTDRPADGQAVAAEVASYRAGVEARLRQAETERAEAVVREGEQRKRRRVVQWSGSLIAAVLVIGLAVSLWLMGRALDAEGQAKLNAQQARDERDAKDDALKKEEQAKQTAEREKTIALTVRDVMKNKLLRQANPYEHSRWAFRDKQSGGQGAAEPEKDLTVRAVLDRAAVELAPERIEEAFPGQPLVQAEVLETIGETYEGIQDFKTAVRFVEAAQVIREKHLGADHPTSLTGRTNLAFAYLAASRLQDAAKLMTTLVETLEKALGELPDTSEGRDRHPVLKRVDAVLVRMSERANPHSFVYPRFELTGVDAALLALQFPALVGRVERLAGQFARRFGANDRRTLVVETWQAFALHAMGQTRKASEKYEGLLERAQRQLPANDSAVEGLREILISTYADLGIKSADRIRLLKDAYQSRLRQLGPQHPNTVDLLGNLAGAYSAAGQFDQALPLYEETLKRRKATLGPDHPDTLTSMDGLAVAYLHAGQFDQALPLLKETFIRTKAKLGPDHPDTLASMNNLAGGFQETGKIDEALPLYEETLKIRKARLGPDHSDTLASMKNLAGAYQAAGKLDKALPLMEETLKQRKAKLGPDHADTLQSMGSMAECYRAAGKLDKALPLLEETLKLRRAKFGPDHPETLASMNNLARAYQDAGNLNHALPLYEDSLKRMKAKLGPDHPTTLACMIDLAGCYKAVSKLDQAWPLFKEALKRMKAKLGPDHPSTLISMHNLARAYQDAGNLDQALPLYEETHRRVTAKLGPDHPTTLACAANLAEGYRVGDQVDQALPLMEETLKRMKAKLGPDHPSTLACMNNLAMAYQDAGHLDRALRLHEETLKLRNAKLGPDHPHTLGSMNNLAVSYRAAGKFDQAVPLFEQSFKRMKARLGPDQADTLKSLNGLALAYQDASKLDLALPLFEECLKLRNAKLGPDHPDTLASKYNLARAYSAARQKEKAVPLLREFVASQRKRFPKEDPRFAGLLAGVSLDLLTCDQYITAEQMLRESLSIRDKTQPDAWTTFNTQSMLGGALLGQKKYAEAEPLLLKGYEGMKAREKSIPPQGQIRIPEALDRLIELYTATNKPDEVKKWQAARAKYPAGENATPQGKK